MQDRDGTEMNIGDQVKQFGVDNAPLLEIESFEDEAETALVVCKAVPSGEPHQLLIDAPAPDGPVRACPPDNVRFRFQGSDLVVAT